MKSMIISDLISAAIWKAKKVSTESFLINRLVPVQHNFETLGTCLGRTKRRSNPCTALVKIRRNHGEDQAQK